MNRPFRRRVRVDGVEAGEAEPLGISGEPLFALVAHLMDSVFRVPGTRFRFGLDPLLGFVPGVGDGAGLAVSVALMGLGMRYGLPKIVVARMALNVLINALVGMIPGIGDAFSFWFKSNLRNYELFRQHAGKGGVSTVGDWIFVGAILLVLVGVVIGGILVWWTILAWLARQIGLI